MKSAGRAGEVVQTMAARCLFAAVGLVPVVSLVTAGLARRWMDEDAFINLRVARNLLSGRGPVFNAGERVEAITSPLWLALVTALGALRIRMEYAAVFGGIALAGLGLLLAQDGALRLRVGRSRIGARWARPTWPIGAAIVAALPAVWDYASSGLETGLGQGWLGASYALVSRCVTGPPRSRTATALGAALLGMGPLIRPEFALYSAAFLAPFAWATIGEGPEGPQAKLRRSLEAVTLVAACAAAVPFAYQIFRMGYYACAVPNTALAKEAFLANWPQGWAYFKNFFATYRMTWPLLGAFVIWMSWLEDDLVTGRWILSLCSVTPVAAAGLHVLYLVRLGGDYMHGRLFVPAVFAGLLPVMATPIGALRPLHQSLPRGLAIVVVSIWAIVCAVSFRVGTENVADIGDERSWYVREAKVSNPVEIESFHDHFFAESARKWLQRVRTECAPGAAPATRKSSARCRSVFLDDDKPQIVPAPGASPLRDGMSPDVSSVLAVGAIGVVGYMLPSDLHVVDDNGLSDPIVGRFELARRGRPGHEKTLPAAWLLGRFARPDDDEDAAVTAARHALHCGRLEDLGKAITGPMTAHSFVHNLSNAWAFSELRIPRDPFDAEQVFCRTPARPEVMTGGHGGLPFRWLCRSASPVAGLRVEYKPGEKAISQVQPLCSPGDGSGAGDQIVGPAYGESADAAFDVTCPPGSVAVGVYGRSDDLIRSVGMVCRQGKALVRTSADGVEGGHRFERVCPHGRGLGFVGRSGALVDALGIVCDVGSSVSE